MSNPESKLYLKERKRSKLTKKAAIEACAGGRIRGNFIGDNLKTTYGEKYSDGYKSSLVANLELKINMVVKHGGSEILDEARMMQEINSQSSLRPKLFPEIFGTFQLEDNVYGMLIERLSGFSTLYQAIYENTTDINSHEIDFIAKSLFRRLEKFYSNGSQENDKGVDFVDLYIRRIQEKLNLIKNRKFGDILFPQQILINGDKYKSPETILEFFNKINVVKKVYYRTHLVHGDPHIGNIFTKKLKRTYSIKFIDPNPAWNYCDYLYDVGKLYHWIEEVGFINYENHGEREKIKRHAINARSFIQNDILKIFYTITDTSEINEVQKRRLLFLNQLNHWSKRISRVMQDPNASWRLHLSIASAHAGLLPLVNNKPGFLLIYARLIDHLNLAKQKFEILVN